MWIHDFKNLITHKKLWHAMINIGAINSRHTKIYVVTKNHGLPWKFVIPCCQMAWHVIITWKIEPLLITKDNNIFNYKWNQFIKSTTWIIMLTNRTTSFCWHMTWSCYHHGRLSHYQLQRWMVLATNKNWKKYDNLPKQTNKLSYWLHLQNHDATWHADVFYNYLMIIMTKYL
jgi:hypothetical protein